MNTGSICLLHSRKFDLGILISDSSLFTQVTTDAVHFILVPNCPKWSHYLGCVHPKVQVPAVLQPIQLPDSALGSQQTATTIPGCLPAMWETRSSWLLSSLAWPCYSHLASEAMGRRSIHSCSTFQIDFKKKNKNAEH